VYDPALDKGLKKNDGVRVPTLPRKVKDELKVNTAENIEAINKRSQIMPKERK
jgi:hypothetical protein